MIYLDNCSTTHKKPRNVIKATLLGLKKMNVNSGRSRYNLNIKGGLKVFELRENIAKFFNFNKPENVILTSGCTMSLNLAIQGTIKSGGHIIATIYEHNSVLRVLEAMKKKHDISYTLIKPNLYGKITPKEVEEAVTSNTYMVIINQTSNVVGNSINITNIGNYCKNKKLIFLVDCAQSAGHEHIDVIKDNINLLAIAGHKSLFGPQGIGALIINNVNINPIIYGGTGTKSESILQPKNIPDGFECGTYSISNVLGLNAGIKFTAKKIKKINSKIKSLSKILLTYLNNNPRILCYSKNEKSGVIAFNFKNFESGIVDNYLSRNGIMIRSGLHCAPFVHKYYSTINCGGMIRVSLSYFNNKSQILKLIKILNKFTIENY